MNNIKRIGNFTSSEIVRLMGNAKKDGELSAPALTYVSECNRERRLGRPLENEADARATQWGTICEAHVFGLLDIHYSVISKQTIVHPEFDFWAGSPDTSRLDTTGDIKCPFTLNSFCQLVDAWEANGIKGIRDSHKDGEKFYWQIVSNCVLKNTKYGELIVYAPYKSELKAIKDMTQTSEFIHDNYGWLFFAGDDSLPWLYDGGHYKNLNHFRFEVPDHDRKALRDKVVKAGELLSERFEPVLIES